MSCSGLSSVGKDSGWLVGGGEDNSKGRESASLVRRELFISYSHHDVRWLEHLSVHLKPLERLYGLQRWDDRRIEAGDQWLPEIEEALARARVALLLVSPHFLASEFIERKELPPLFEAARNGGLTILWVPLRPCNWRLHPQIEPYQAVFPPQRTLAEMEDWEQDKTMVKITETIQKIVSEANAAHMRQADQMRQAEIQQQQIRQDELRKEEAQKEADRQEEARKQREEKDRLDRLKSENDRQDRLKAEREARAEAERWRAEAERLAREKEELQRQAKRSVSPSPIPSAQTQGAPSPATSLIEIRTKRGWLVRVKKGWLSNEWQIKTEVISVKGYEEKLAEGIGLTMVRIPAGEFQMGSPATEAERFRDEDPQHLVRLESFFLGQTPVTQEQWQVVAGWPKVGLDLNPTPSRFDGAKRPVEQVSWLDAMEFCRRLSQRTKQMYTLPSEAQWEYACRAGTITPFAFGEMLTPELANYDGNYTYESGPKGVYRQQTTEVGSFPANAWGLQDMHGNVLEWCLDHWHDKYQGAPIDGSIWAVGASEQGARLLRGGSWLLSPWYCRSASRSWGHRGARDSFVGFRLCVFPPGLLS